MKKVFGWLVALAMVLSMSLAVSAAPESTGCGPVVHKQYLTHDGAIPATFPKETLSFEVAAKEGNPDEAMISIGDLTVEKNPADVAITIPTYTKVGKYNYTVKEIAGNTQGVVYTENQFDVQVLAYWNDDHTEIKTITGFTTQNRETMEKIDTFVNTYNLGDLEITKKVTGNLGDRDKEFLVDVSFYVEEGKSVKSDITYLDGEKTMVITPKDLEDGQQTVTVSLKHDETVSFTNIPYGVIYTVKERDYTRGDLNSPDGYDTPLYALNDEMAEHGDDGVREVIDTQMDKVTITNNKEAQVDTGVLLDSLPYGLILMVVAAGFIALIVRKHHIAE